AAAGRGRRLRRRWGAALPLAAREPLRRRAAGRRRAPPTTRPLPRGARARAGPGRRARAAVPPRPGCREECPMTTIELRRLLLDDLAEIEEIERRSYPT